MNLFEQSAASVSEAIKTKQASGSAVRDLAAYLFRAYIRKPVSESRRKDATLCKNLSTRRPKARFRIAILVRAEAALLLDEIMRTCDRLTREVAFRRLEGLSWYRSASGKDSRSTRLRRDFQQMLDRARKG